MDNWLKFCRIRSGRSLPIGEVVLSMRMPNAGYRKAMELIDKHDSPSFPSRPVAPSPLCDAFLNSNSEILATHAHVHTLKSAGRVRCNGVATGFLSAPRMIYCRHEQAPRNLRIPSPAFTPQPSHALSHTPPPDLRCYFAKRPNSRAVALR